MRTFLVSVWAFAAGILPFLMLLMALARTGPDEAVSKLPPWLTRKDTDTFVIKWGKRSIPALFVVGIISFIVWYRSPPETNLLPTPEISHDQYLKLNEVASFFSRDESALRQEFDFENMCRFNIAMWHRNLFSTSDNSEYQKWLGAGFKDATLLFSYNRMNLSQQPGGRIILLPTPYIYYIATSRQYQKAQDQVREYELSLLVPHTVKNALYEFSDIVSEDIDLLLLF